MYRIGRIFLLIFLLANLYGLGTGCLQADQPNVLLIVCDDLNDYVEGYDGHPQTKTPNIHRLSQTGVRFLLISGAPLREPVAWHGPIVMNTRAELQEAFRELNSGRFVKTAADSWFTSR